MITIEDITYEPYKIGSTNGLPLVFVIDGQCVYDFPATEYGTQLFMKNNGIIDISNEYPDYEGSSLKIIIDNDNFEILQTSEYLGSILLTVDKALCLWDYPYGSYVSSPDATFNGEEFYITNRDMSMLQPYPYEIPRTSSDFFMV